MGPARTARKESGVGPRTALLLAFLLGTAAACGGTGSPAGDPNDDARDERPLDTPEAGPDTPDAGAEDLPADEPRDVPVEARDADVEDRDSTDVPPQDADAADAPDPADAPLDPAPDLDLPADDGDPDEGDPGPACDPDAGPCPCTTHADCPDGTYCDGTLCHAWMCVPGVRFCDGTRLLRCSPEGGGFTVVEDCDDGDPCTVGDGCAGTRCLTRTAVACDDSNPCTADACDHATGACASTPADGTVCDDGDPCTANDRCLDGACRAGGATSCSDANPCTADWCTSLLGCVHEPVSAYCVPSADACAVGGECRAGACADLDVDCDDGDPCTLDACLGGACAHGTVAGCACQVPAECDDGEACTEEQCVNGRCAHVVAALPGCCETEAACDDGDPCTADACAGVRCRHLPVPGEGCCQPPDLRATFDDGTPDDFLLDPANPGSVGWRLQASPGGNGMSLYFGNSDGTGYGTGLRVSGAALSPPITLPAGVSASLSFRTWQDVEAVTGQDPFVVEAITAERSGHLAWSRPAGFAMRTWSPVTVDLSALAGRTVRVRFAFDTLDGTANDGQGVFVDDVVLSSPCRPVPCDRESDCVSLGWHGGCHDGACDFTDTFQRLGTRGGTGSPVTFTGPSDVAVSPDGTTVYVSDRDAHRVQVLDADGRAGPLAGGYGTAPGRLILPRGLAAAGDRVYVADTGNHRVQAFSPAGVFLWSFGSKGTEPGRFNEPKGVALSPDGATLWVADTSNHRVQGITLAGVVRTVIGSYGKLNGQFRSPSCVVPLPDGDLLVCDTQNNRLQVFSVEGAHRATFAPTDQVPLLQPYGAAPAGDGLVWVSDTYNHRLVLLETTGAVRDRFGSYGAGPTGFDYPLGMESDASGRLFVVDSGNRRVVILGRGPVP